MITPPLQTPDFWRVNSYSYPNPFNSDAKSQESWTTFRSFYDYNGAGYNDLKTYWRSSKAPRRLDNHAVESWKAAFEEFGLLYVISRSNEVTITPAGQAMFDAVAEDDQDNFVWLGLNLLFRYPLHGPPRRSRNQPHNSSDVLPYRLLYSVMRDVGDYFWWTELERVLCRVFRTAEAPAAVDAIRWMRANPSDLDQFPVPVDKRKGAFYNSLNQVANHAGLNHLVLVQDQDSQHYGPNESRRRHSINRDYLSLLSAALGDAPATSDCRVSARYVDRLPTAPSFNDELAYFQYLGAPIASLKEVEQAAGPKAINLAGDLVFVLQAGIHFKSINSSPLERLIEGKIMHFCQIGRNHRVILSTDLNWTYLVIGKDMVGPDAVRLRLRRARPITNPGPVEALLGDNHD